MTIRVAVADDHNLVRQGIHALLDRASGIEVVGEAANGIEALGLVEHLQPDVLVMDVAMPRMNGNQAVQRVRALGSPTQVVMLSMYSNDTLVRQALRNGARGYVLKQSVSEELLLAIRAAVRGEIFLSSAISTGIVAEYLEHHAGADAASPYGQLTARECEVLQLVAEGHTNIAIGRMLNISPRTVEKHRASVMSKLDVHDLAGLVRAAIRHGLVSVDE